jgi:hypothetical protein
MTMDRVVEMDLPFPGFRRIIKDYATFMYTVNFFTPALQREL